MNPHASSSRLYALTRAGQLFQATLVGDRLPPKQYDLPGVDWESYGAVCFSHRSAVIKALTRPMSPAAIKRRALSQNAHLKMSANNVRDVLKVLLHQGVVWQVRVRKKAHPLYELTDKGKRYRDLLLQAERI